MRRPGSPSGLRSNMVVSCVAVIVLAACGSAHADHVPPKLPMPPCAAGLQRDGNGQCVGWLVAPSLATTRKGMALTLDDTAVWAIGGSAPDGHAVAEIEALPLDAPQWQTRGLWKEAPSAAHALTVRGKALLMSPAGVSTLDLVTGAGGALEDARIAIPLGDGKTFVWGAKARVTTRDGARVVEAPAGEPRFGVRVGARLVFIVARDGALWGLTSDEDGAKWTAPQPLGADAVAALVPGKAHAYVVQAGPKELRAIALDPVSGKLVARHGFDMDPSGAIATTLRDGRLVLFGTQGDTTADGGKTLVVRYWDPLTKVVTAGPAPVGLSRFDAATPMADGRILVSDGHAMCILVM